ncbi:hypothetical protein XAPC_4314 [Xanthomonas citri pv. punicae str. LMG 859]|nr:hypothetical protein XAPC_4314 [Xanthomonas citri pv. punicae str. LMG 859]
MHDCEVAYLHAAAHENLCAHMSIIANANIVSNHRPSEQICKIPDPHIGPNVDLVAEKATCA